MLPQDLLLNSTMPRENIEDTTTGLFSALQLGTPAGEQPGDPLKLTAYGANAKFNYNGIELEQATNQFVLAGVTYTLTGTSDTETVNINSISSLSISAAR